MYRHELSTATPYGSPPPMVGAVGGGAKLFRPSSSYKLITSVMPVLGGKKIFFSLEFGTFFSRYSASEIILSGRFPVVFFSFSEN